MDLIHSSSSFFGFASAFSFTGAGRARAAARVWGVGTGLMRAGAPRRAGGAVEYPPVGGGAVGEPAEGLGGGGPPRRSAGPYEYPPGGGCAQAAGVPPEYARWSRKFPFSRKRKLTRKRRVAERTRKLLKRSTGRPCAAA